MLQYISAFGERAMLARKRKHLRSVGLMTANEIGDVPAIVRGLLSGGDILEGDCIAEFEAAFSRVMGGGEVFSFGAGRVAMAAILDALQIGAGDEVIMPGYTCVVVPNPVLYRDAKPVYVDIDRRSLNLDPDEVKRRITPRTRAIVVQHTFGLPADFEPIARIARPLGIKLIEDCTHALGATYFGRRVGTLGDASFFSMEQSKLISTGMGGVAFTRDPEIARRLSEFQRQQCAWPEPTDVKLTLSYILYQALLQGPRTVVLGDLFGYYLHRLGLMKTPEYSKAELQCRCPPGFLKRLPNALARVAVAQLKRLPQNLARRKAVARIYDAHLPALGYTIPVSPPEVETVYLRYPLWVDDKNGLASYMTEQEIGIGMWFTSPIHPKGVAYEHALYSEGSCPNAEAAVRHVVNLPSHPRMNERDAMRVVAALGAYRQEHARSGAGDIAGMIT